MSTYASVQSFVRDITDELARIDGFICNAGLMTDAWSQSEGMETSMFVNVINTVFLGALMMLKLKECASKFNIKPALVFIVSVLGYIAKSEMDKSRNGVIFDGLNDQKRANMDSR
jgi:NAD(P)-dependent dehydrogenase (short-subunit alcohol dehydrogenase family)